MISQLLLRGKNIARDPMLKWMLFVPLIYALLVRWGFSFLANWLEARFAISLTPYLTLIASFLILSLVTLLGIVIGFLILDERDDQTLIAMKVTPLPQPLYLANLILPTYILGFLLTLILIPLLGIVPPTHLIRIALAYATVPPLYALSLAVFAKNKVQGFALVKSVGVGVFNVAPTLSYFLPPKWQLLFTPIPTYWPLKVFWTHSLFPLLICYSLFFLLLWYLVSQFEKIVK